MSDVDITMPQLGETVAEGTVLRWLLEEGDPVEAEAPVLEVATDKVDTEVVAPVSGVLRQVLVSEGETVAVGTVLAKVQVGDADGSAVPDTDLTEEGLVSAQRTAAPTDAGSSGRLAPSSTGGSRHRDTPRVRRLAREQGVDLTLISTSGRNGRATVDDVFAAVNAAAESPERPVSAPSREEGPASVVDKAATTSGTTPLPARRGRVEALSRRRRVIAERMHRSLQESAQLTTVVEVDLTHVVRAREAAKEAFRNKHGISLSVLAFVAEAAVRALDEHPVIHAELDLKEGTVTYPSAVGLGIAVDTEEGLVVPVIRDADDLSVGGLARRIAELASRSRGGTATADDYAGGTFTITNTGSRGPLFDTPILNAPQASILGVGAVVRRPMALLGENGDELIAVRSMAYLSLTYDHRLVDGADASRYLGTVKKLLEAPSRSWADAVGLKEAV